MINKLWLLSLQFAYRIRHTFIQETKNGIHPLYIEPFGFYYGRSSKFVHKRIAAPLKNAIVNPLEVYVAKDMITCYDKNYSKWLGID